MSKVLKVFGIIVTVLGVIFGLFWTYIIYQVVTVDNMTINVVRVILLYLVAVAVVVLGIFLLKLSKKYKK